MYVTDKNMLINEITGGQVPFTVTSNVSDLAIAAPLLIVMHYTGGAWPTDRSVDWMSRSEAKASAQLFIDYDGSVTQMGNPTKGLLSKCWHAGESTWGGLTNLNRYAIGIEMANPGPLKYTKEGYVASGKIVPEHLVFRDENGDAWVAYAEEQITAAVDVCVALMDHYRSIGNIVRHSDIAPQRKVDPGPAFPFEQFKHDVMLARRTTSLPAYIVTANSLRVRDAPAGTIIGALPQDSIVVVDSTGVDGWVKLTTGGWVSGSYLRKLDL